MSYHHASHPSHPHEHAGHSHLHGVVDPTVVTTAHRPRSRRVAEITGMENMLDATVAGKYRDGLELDWDGHKVCVTAGCGHVGNVVTFTVRPQDVHIAPEWDGSGPGMNMFHGRVERVRPCGPTQFVPVRVGQTSVL
jgi:ABC-type Fe3+/spermidine/putrescine transport system ATPase subunit